MQMDKSQYRPEGYDHISSYYDGAGIYRGELPYGGVKRFILQSFDTPVKGVRVTPDNHMLALSAAARVNLSGNRFGYVLLNRLGALMFIDPRYPQEPRYVWDFAGEPILLYLKSIYKSKSPKPMAAPYTRFLSDAPTLNMPLSMRAALIAIIE